MRSHCLLVYAGIALFILSTAASAQNQPKAEEYYLLQIDNIWHYTSSLYGPYTVEIADMVWVSGISYYTVVRTDNRGRTSSHLARIDGNKVYHKIDDRDELMFIDFSVPPGKTYPAQQGGIDTRVTFEAFHDALEVGGKLFENVIVLYHDVPGMENYRSYFARNIGRVGIVWEEREHTAWLTGAVIDGEGLFSDE